MVTHTADRPVPPYVSYRTFRTFVEGLRVTMPGRIDRSVMGTMSGATSSQLLAALKYLRLINTDGTPTEKLVRIVNSTGTERQEALRHILTSAYSFLFDRKFDLQRSTTRQLEERFNSAGASGQTIRKCVAFFVAVANDADILLSPYIKSTRSARMGRVKSARTQVIDASQSDTRTGVELNDKPTTVEWQQLLLSKFPEFDPAWPDEVKTRWFEAFDHLMRMGPKPEKNHRRPGRGA